VQNSALYKTYKAYLMGVPWKTKEKKSSKEGKQRKIPLKAFKIPAQADLIRGR
jgi:hypothetical protein